MRRCPILAGSKARERINQTIEHNPFESKTITESSSYP